VVIPKQSRVHTTTQKNLHVKTLGRDLQINKRNFLNPMEDCLSKVVPYHVSSCLGNHRVFLGSLVLSKPSGSSDFLSKDEDDPSSIYGSPLHGWIDQACGYSFRWDDQAYGFSFQ
jgi:hypothetical protein